MMAAGAGSGLRALRDQPFALLRALERRSRAAVAGAGPDEAEAAELVGIGFRLGSERLLLERGEVREILLPPAGITRVPGARSWVRGLANVRGQLLPVMDLKDFLGAGPTVMGRSTRILVARGGELPVGLLADEVYGFRRFLDRERGAAQPLAGLRCERFLAGCFRRGDESWPLFRLQTLLDSPEFQLAAAD
jgi:twitching motility protein PilI